MKYRNIVWLFLKKISSLNFSILLLSLISLFIMIGSIIEQNQNFSYYQTYYPINDERIFYINWQLILFFGLDHLYQTWWFILLLMIFASSLLICTFSTQLPSLQNSRRWKFFNSISNQTNHQTELKKSENNLKNSSINAIHVLNYHGFYVFHKKEYLYAYKGLLGRLAPIFVHFSIIFILLGSIFSVLWGYTAQEIIPTGEIFHIKNLVNSGIYSKLKTHFTYKIDDFYLEYNSDDSIKQFFSVLSIIDNQNQLITSKKIFVNSPLKFRRLTFYQTDWNVNSIRLQVGLRNNPLLQQKLLKINLNNKVCWFCKIPIENNKQIYLILFNIDNKIFISDGSGFILDSISKNQIFYINNVPILVKEVILDTGLQIKTDLGIEIVYLGFLVLMLTTLMSYISYSQVWIYIKNNFFNISGSTNRAILFFEEDIAKINFFYSYYTFSTDQKISN
uniref:Cytochrome c biogenesis protein Ccs1 n=1 Tax=Caloglossa monosticha TaxID=76906 RepID=A0A1Z1M556_9FLOR|nr:cytochrome c biogenesis protein ccs1 [Caloglossa monosticha]ARW60971.1 cytochrome c biogenesis protein ccs1 [Caloglossa monosticha]